MIISEKHKFFLFWNIFTITLVIYQSVIIPLEFGFSITSKNQAILNFIDAMFFIDFVLMFFTSFRNSMGEEVFDMRHIAMNYVTSARFFIDFFSQLGGNYISKFYRDLRFFGILKILRVFRLGSMV